MPEQCFSFASLIPIFITNTWRTASTYHCGLYLLQYGGIQALHMFLSAWKPSGKKLPGAGRRSESESEDGQASVPAGQLLLEVHRGFTDEQHHTTQQQSCLIPVSLKKNWGHIPKADMLLTGYWHRDITLMWKQCTTRVLQSQIKYASLKRECKWQHNVLIVRYSNQIFSIAIK